MMSKVWLFIWYAFFSINISIEQQGGVLFNVVKPGNNDNGNWTGPDDQYDGCKRQYPVTDHSPKGIDIAYKRYSISPQVVPFAPEDYLEVSTAVVLQSTKFN